MTLKWKGEDSQQNSYEEYKNKGGQIRTPRHTRYKYQ